MQASRSSRSGVVYRQPDSEEPANRFPPLHSEPEEEVEEPPQPATSVKEAPDDPIAAAAKAVLSAVQQHPAAAAAAAAVLAAAAASAALLSWRASRPASSRQRLRQHAASPPASVAASQSGQPAAGAPAGDGGEPAAANGLTASEAGSSTSLGKPKRSKPSAAAAAAPEPPGPLAGLRPTASCVALSDGSACVIRRRIAADNSCLFNAVGYSMHHSHNRAPFLRAVVAREVASDPEQYSDVFLAMPNAAYCAWIVNPVNWGGGIELAILAAHYHREIAAWNIESGRRHVFGEEKGYKKQVMVVYTGTHYDVLAVASHPRASTDDDVTEFNPRTKRGKMILAAAEKLTALNNPARVAAARAASVKAAAGLMPVQCSSCGDKLANKDAAVAHAAATGHTQFTEMP